MTQDQFDDILKNCVHETPSIELLSINGIYEILSEYFNNEVLERWANKQDVITLMGEDEIIKLAENFIDENFDRDFPPEDEWYNLTDELDINIFSEIDGKLHAIVYPVNDDKTDITQYVEIC